MIGNVLRLLAQTGLGPGHKAMDKVWKRLEATQKTKTESLVYNSTIASFFDSPRKLAQELRSVLRMFIS